MRNDVAKLSQLKVKQGGRDAVGFDRRSVGRALLSLAAVCLAFAIPVSAQTTADLRESRLKAVFLSNFVKLVEWPTDAFASSASPVVIGILGVDPFGPDLVDSVAQKTVDGREMVVVHFNHLNDVTTCHVLFVSSSETNALSGVLESLTGRPILTVGDGEGFACKGGIIGLIKRAGDVRFEVNLQAAEQAGLKLSSRLLKLAKGMPPNAGEGNPAAGDSPEHGPGAQP